MINLIEFGIEDKKQGIEIKNINMTLPDKGVVLLQTDALQAGAIFAAITKDKKYSGTVVVPKLCKILRYGKSLCIPEFLSGKQYLEIIATNEGIKRAHIKNVINNACQEAGLSVNKLNVPIKVLNGEERARLMLAKASIEVCDAYLFDSIFEYFDMGDMPGVIRNLNELKERALVIVATELIEYTHILDADVLTLG